MEEGRSTRVWRISMVAAQLFNDDRIRSTLDVVHQYASDIQNALALRAMTEFAVPADTVAYDGLTVFRGRL